MLCFTRPGYQVSVYRTIGPLVYLSHDKLNMPTSNRIHNTTWRQTVGIEHYYHKNS